MARKLLTLIVFVIFTTLACTPVLAYTKSDRLIDELDKRQNIKKEEFKIIRPAVEYDVDVGRDPFKNLLIPDSAEITSKTPLKTDSSTTKTLPALTIQGIIWGGSLKQAIVNDKVVKEGDMIASARIIEISKNGIVVLYMNKQYIVNAPAVDFITNLKKVTTKKK
ncbi:MAG: hypothetical protein WDL87_06140 [Candidatus Omnitrophota bacterium]